jgi:two-component system, OmpR family, phosphate regulon response regulator PhoB
MAKTTLERTILIIEDEPDIRDMVKFALNDAGFHLLEAETPSQAEIILLNQLPDLILLDWMLPECSGIQFAKKLKKQTQTENIPIIMLTAKAEEENKIRGLEAGADDYMTKPFSPKELIARIKTVLRRGLLVSPNGIITLNQLVLDNNAHEVRINDQRVDLSRIEFKLLSFFMSHQGRVYTREQLLNHVWSNDALIDERTVDVQIVRLRKVLSQYHCPPLIHTVHGVGYKFANLVENLEKK